MNDFWLGRTMKLKFRWKILEPLLWISNQHLIDENLFNLISNLNTLKLLIHGIIRKKTKTTMWIAFYSTHKIESILNAKFSKVKYSNQVLLGS